ncbi:MAG: hypothetical protein A4S09_17225 [Proteobacteria bacterium SG_bin7]|nr:MAG: hypothetical protein A4S09_17225 [Proteobacteria bacterium SG_bin7]
MIVCLLKYLKANYQGLVPLLRLVSTILTVLSLNAEISFAQDNLSQFLSRKQFESLAAELAPKVNIFRAIWQENPGAEFYGGTTRDYLYWLRGRLNSAKSVEELAGIISELRSLATIDIADFIIGESDIDVISSRSLNISGSDFGIKKSTLLILQGSIRYLEKVSKK